MLTSGKSNQVNECFCVGLKLTLGRVDNLLKFILPKRESKIKSKSPNLKRITSISYFKITSVNFWIIIVNCLDLPPCYPTTFLSPRNWCSLPASTLVFWIILFRNCPALVGDASRSLLLKVVSTIVSLVLMPNDYSLVSLSNLRDPLSSLIWTTWHAF